MAKRFGIMLDCSRNAMMKIDEMKKLISTLKAMGYNMIQLYTEDTYECDGEPYFGYMRGRYSKADIREIVDYCNSLGVEAIPCIQTLAHLENMFKWKEYSSIKDFGNILLVGEERTYELIENMVKTARQCYDTNIIHIGMDEAHMLGLGKYLDKHGYCNRFDILKEHLDRVIEICHKYDFHPIMWSDMFFRLANGGGYYEWKNITDEIVSKKPEGVDLVYWDYYSDKYEKFRGMMDAHLRFSGETWFAGGLWTWIGPAPFTTFSIRSMGEGMRALKESGTDNVFFCMWGDDGKECSVYSMLPALYALRRMYDGVTDMEVIKADFAELTGENYDDMMALELPNAVVGSNIESPSNVSKSYLWSDVLFGFSDVTVRDGGGKEFAEVEKIIREAGKRSKSYGYIFENLANLSSVMEIKYELGKRTRDTYKSGDKEALSALLADYDELVKRLVRYHESFRYQWHKENKPHGFEIQDMRLGGLIQRIKSAKARIEAYLSGEIDKLEELEEELLPYKLALDKYFAIDGIPGTDGIPSVDKGRYICTVNNY